MWLTIRHWAWKLSPHLAQVGGGSQPSWPQAGHVGVQQTIFGNVRLPKVLSLIQEKMQDYIYMHTWVKEAKSVPNR